MRAPATQCRATVRRPRSVLVPLAQSLMCISLARAGRPELSNRCPIGHLSWIRATAAPLLPRSAFRAEKLLRARFGEIPKGEKGDGGDVDEQSSMGFSLRQRGCNVYSHGSSIEPPVSSCAQAQDTEVRPSLGTNVRAKTHSQQRWCVLLDPPSVRALLSIPRSAHGIMPPICPVPLPSISQTGELKGL